MVEFEQKEIKKRKKKIESVHIYIDRKRKKEKKLREKRGVGLTLVFWIWLLCRVFSADLLQNSPICCRSAGRNLSHSFFFNIDRPDFSLQIYNRSTQKPYPFYPPILEEIGQKSQIMTNLSLCLHAFKTTLDFNNLLLIFIEIKNDFFKHFFIIYQEKRQ